MSKFRTSFKIPPLKTPMNYSSQILSMGSCFSENIGNKLADYKFNIIANPFGILYNPESIANAIDLLIKKKRFNKEDLFEHQGVWHSFYHHSRFSHTHANQCLKNINQALTQASEKLQTTNFILITLGTAWVYELKSTGKIVSNCHKISATNFRRFKLNTCDIVERYTALINKIKTKNPSCQVIFTISPVRHLKDGAAENQLSKATLINGVHELVETFDQVHYFPSYEIMMDDLRDYRFYASDMIHPSEQAVEYIWEKFKTACIDNTNYQTMHTIDKIKSAVNHRPFQPNTVPHKKFLNNTLQKIYQLQSDYPDLDFKTEILAITQQIKHLTI